MTNAKPQGFVPNIYGCLRSDMRVILCIFLLIYILFAYGEWNECIREREQVMGTLNILRQMQTYGEDYCPDSPTKVKHTMDKHNRHSRENIEKRNITKVTVKNEVTFVLLGPTIQCLSDKVSWIKRRYEGAKILIALAIGTSAIKEQVGVKMASSEVHFLGHFTNLPKALNHAIQFVNTEYFMIIDHEMDVANVQENFIELFLPSIPNYDILSGSVVNTYGEYAIPCIRLKLQHWSYYETYQYNISGNVLQCDAISSLYFIAHAKVIKSLLNSPQKLVFDENLPSKWLEDFFISNKKFLEVGILPKVVIRQKFPKACFVGPSTVNTTSNSVKMLLPFARKHNLFHIHTETNHIDICTDSGTLACSEKSIQKKWNIGHWSDGGLSTYPFVIQSLRKALHFGTRRLEESQLMYVIEGGTLLGMVKLRDILPWDHGDIDTFVYSTRRKVIDMVKHTFHKYGYEFWLRHTGFHTYVSEDPTSLNGCFVYLTRRLKPKAIVYMRYQGKLFPVKRDLFRFLRQFYGSVFLENHMKISNQRSFCQMPGHHACMPDCRWNGCGGRLN